mmetsp:Transcript_1161/g.1332  ORF Transcript_1161/g.1332 Transcript_1161/m.1332 type:complete len:87 (+) Transcript_1161:3-263(+)
MLMRQQQQQQQHSGVGASDGVGGGRVTTGAPTKVVVGASEATTEPVIRGRGRSGMAAAADKIGMATGPVFMGKNNNTARTSRWQNS